jgi:hypothetical protein
VRIVSESVARLARIRFCDARIFRTLSVSSSAGLARLIVWLRFLPLPATAVPSSPRMIDRRSA